MATSIETLNCFVLSPGSILAGAVKVQSKLVFCNLSKEIKWISLLAFLNNTGKLGESASKLPSGRFRHPAPPVK